MKKRPSLVANMKAAKDKATGKASKEPTNDSAPMGPADALTDMTTTAIHIRLSQLRLLQDVASYRQRAGKGGRVSVSDVIRDLIDGRLTAADLKRLKGEYRAMMAAD